MSSLGEEVEEEWEDERVEADSLLGNVGCWIPKAIHLLQSAPKLSPSEAVPNPTHTPSGTLSFKVSHITSSEYIFRLSDTGMRGNKDTGEEKGEHNNKTERGREDEGFIQSDSQ
ncbi:hypothetical protein NQZ68_030675 [Dissostichus eleginoides]|nr:hypothetical protein NQZ68_030675 [Dissostichus eleginoides]